MKRIPDHVINKLRYLFQKYDKGKKGCKLALSFFNMLRFGYQ